MSNLVEEDSESRGRAKVTAAVPTMPAGGSCSRIGDVREIAKINEENVKTRTVLHL